jgi:hypothetical protein
LFSVGPRFPCNCKLKKHVVPAHFELNCNLYQSNH